MHLDALSQIDLYCTACRRFTETDIIQYKLGLIAEETQKEYVISGWLKCSNCGKKYQISEGVPHLTGSFTSEDRFTHQYLDAHFGTLNSGYWQEMNRPTVNGLSLDVGCSVGRYTFDCARNGFAVGIDVNIQHLKMAAGFQRSGLINFRRKTRAWASESVESEFRPLSNVLFLLADIQNPPFKMETFDYVAALNLIDSVSLPLTALGQMDAVLKPKGTLFLSTPYVWNADISQDWLETADIEPHTFVRLLLKGKMMPECGFNYRLSFEKTGIPWLLRQHDTQQFTYFVDAIAAEKLEA